MLILTCVSAGRSSSSVACGRRPTFSARGRQGARAALTASYWPEYQLSPPSVQRQSQPFVVCIGLLREFQATCERHNNVLPLVFVAARHIPGFALPPNLHGRRRVADGCLRPLPLLRLRAPTRARSSQWPRSSGSSARGMSPMGVSRLSTSTQGPSLAHSLSLRAKVLRVQRRFAHKPARGQVSTLAWHRDRQHVQSSVLVDRPHLVHLGGKPPELDLQRAVRRQDGEPLRVRAAHVEPEVNTLWTSTHGHPHALLKIV